MAKQNQKEGPDTTGKVHDRQKEALEIVRDVWGGTLRLRKKGEKYLPKFPKETKDGYESRRKTAVLFNGFRRTVKGLTGMVFRKDPELGEKVPEQIRVHMENVDLAGRDLTTFSQDICDDDLVDGHVHIFVDMQPPVEGAESRDDEVQAGNRPYWVAIEKGQILAFEPMSVGGQVVLRRFRYLETILEPEGEFGQQEVQQIRGYRLRRYSSDDEEGEPGVGVEFRKWRKTEEDDEFQLVEGPRRMVGISRIPLTTAYSNRTGFMESEPPLLDLALENIRHYQLRSDRDNSMHIAGVPIPVFIGLDTDKELKVGSEDGVKLPEGGDAKYLEPTGAALSATRDELRDIEQRMAALGLAMLQRDTRAAETAEARRIEKSESDSALSRAARNLEAALQEALSFHAEWLETDDPGTVTVNQDFESLVMDPRMVQVLNGMVNDGNLSHETLWSILQTGEILPDDFDADVELQRIEEGDMEALDRLRRTILSRQGAGDTPPQEE